MDEATDRGERDKGGGIRLSGGCHPFPSTLLSMLYSIFWNLSPQKIGCIESSSSCGEWKRILRVFKSYRYIFSLDAPVCVFALGKVDLQLLIH
jgi:hypothetical protein